MRLVNKLLVVATVCCLGLFYACKKKHDDINPTSSLVCPAESDPSMQSHPKTQRFQALMQEYVKKGLPGMTLMVRDASGTFAGAAGMADIHNGVKMQPCHISKAASITKMFMGVTALRMQEDGLLNLDDPITKYVDGDDLRKLANVDGNCTLRSLMAHRTGTYDVITDNNFYLQVLNDPAKHWTPNDLLKYVRGKDAVFPYNSTSGYSNTNTLLLSMAISGAAKRPQQDMLHQYVIDHLGLSNTFYHYHDALPQDKVAQGYFDLYNNNTIVNLSNWNTGSGNGYGGLYSNVFDLTTFMEALFVKKTLLKQESIDQMLQFSDNIEFRKYLGVSIFKDFIDIGDPATQFAYGHRGRDLAYSADLFYFPNYNATMALFVNYGTDGNSNLKNVFNEFRDKLAELIVSNN